jgi:hypothetical protein
MTYTRKTSASQIALYQKCPREYYYKYKQKIKAPPTIALVKGSAVHAILEKFFLLNPRKSNINIRNYKTELYIYADEIIEKILHEPQKSFDKLKPSYYEELNLLCANEIELVKEIVDIKTTIHNYLILFIMSLDNYIKSYNNFPQSYYLTRPKFREFKIDLPNFTGYIDSIIENDDYIMIQDYKTSSLYKTGYNEEYIQQLKLYAWGLYKIKGIIPDVGSIMYLKYGREPIIEFNKETIIEEMDNLIEWFFEKTESDDINDYPMNSSHQFCTNCDSKNPKGFKNGGGCWYSQFCNKELELIIKNGD